MSLAKGLVVEKRPLSVCSPSWEPADMFLRRNRRELDGQLYEYWTLVESVRTARGPRQRVVATLGKLPGLDQEEHHGWEELKWLLEGKRRPEQLSLGERTKTRLPPPQWAQVDLSGVRVERVRD